ncbi:MAG: protein-glutamate O-methyltransferase CheR [Nitrospirae bacterium]|nr:protein-glutamate O-methyltransferase CheR [Nitrospirota bacterium]
MLTDEEFRLFRNLIYEEAGIYLKDTRKEFLENRLALRLKATGMSSFYWYYKFVAERRKTELLILLDILTINETSFFRNKPQMEFFRNEILPDVIKGKERDVHKRLRIWSAGCSTGEEPYSIAMLVLDVMNNAPSKAVTRNALRVTCHDWDIKIFASDLSLTAIENASKGEYDEEKVRATVDEHYVDKYFEKASSCHSHESGNPEKKQKTGFPLNNCGNDEKNTFSEQSFYRIKDEVGKLVIFDLHNLKNENGLSDLDVIFCRNVMIYFDVEEQKRLIAKFYRSLNPYGYLLTGHAESLQGMNPGFRFIHHNNGIAYQKIESEVQP